MPFELCPHRAGPVANAGRFRPQFGIANHLLDVPQAVGPLTETFTGDRPTLLIAARPGSVQQLPQIAAAIAALLIAAALAALLLTWLLSLTWLLTLTWLLLTTPLLSAWLLSAGLRLAASLL